MNWSFKIAKILGIDVRIHITFFLLLAFIGLGSYQTGGAAGAVQGVLFICLVFLCVLLHEFGTRSFDPRAGHCPERKTCAPAAALARPHLPGSPEEAICPNVTSPRHPDLPDDHSGAGRPRRDDEEFPEHRSFQEIGTHRGPGRSTRPRGRGHRPARPRRQLNGRVRRTALQLTGRAEARSGPASPVRAGSGARAFRPSPSAARCRARGRAPSRSLAAWW